ncbi:hypothetical protein KSI01_18260 [Kurthia sibirica]|uniref:Uncharacterized protein n=2 Tax=Kurthia sibirica TaxID=202750 RepID=A0A2U3AMV9_9BACL|nr:hypothetical protein DEX24_06545 [Kurthia sibirica]GEK34293.1 hypothetical protein KSI01_18260 [Kurthia sibirica]
MINQKIHFTLKTTPNSSWKPAGRVITDSDDLAFIYTIDENDAFSYLVFKQPLWNSLVAVIESETDPVVVVEDQQIVLTGFFDEIQSLIYNIEGNSNYGDTFVTAVENVFAAILEEA